MKRLAKDERKKEQVADFFLLFILDKHDMEYENYYNKIDRDIEKSNNKH